MAKYILVDESDEPFYFEKIVDICRFLGAEREQVATAIELGDEIQGYTIDEIIN